MIEWTGAGWRLWRVEKSHRGVRLRNPWTNTARAVWEREEVHVAECIWRNRDGSSACNGYVSASCTCGIRSMATLPDLAHFLAIGRQLEGQPVRAWVVGRVHIGGKVQHHIPGLQPTQGYQRSEYAQIDGPLYVSPTAAEHFEAVATHYGSARSPVFGPDCITRADRQQDWLEQLAARTARFTGLTSHGTAGTTWGGRGRFADAPSPRRDASPPCIATGRAWRGHGGLAVTRRA